MQQSSKLYSLEALGTVWHFESLNDKNIDQKIIAEINKMVYDFESNFSRFNKESVVSKLNNSGSINNPPKELVDMMQYAHDVYIKTDGVFNIFIGGQLNNLGYGDGKKSKLNKSDWDQTLISVDKISIPKSASIDLGGLGKGWLIDKISQLFIDSGYEEYVINGGGDLYVNSKTPIELILEHPYDKSQQIGTTKIAKGALAVSSITKRSWNKSGEKHHHIIDPVSNMPTNNNIVASFIKAENALTADTMATCLIIRPELKEELSEIYNLKVILIDKNQIS